MKKTIVPVLIVASVVNLFGMAGTAMAQTAIVPDVVGWGRIDARNALIPLGLSYSETYTASETVQPGHVISQDPPGGTEVPVGTSINLVLCSPFLKIVPDVVGWERADAVDAMVSRSLKVPVTYSPSDTVDAGYVISQDPVGGTVVIPGSDVTLTISTGPENVEVPDVVGDSETDADSAITSVGLTVSHIHKNSETVAAGYVISQDPAAGTELSAGSVVNVTVSLGPDGS